MPYYQFNIEPQDGSTPTQIMEYRKNDGSARARAGALAKQNDCPVDLAYEGDGSSDWNDLYITTAMPSEFHVSGVRFERLDG